jgi:formamidopyrimidine-DNA glycosylase
MPELPEVETTRRGIAPLIEGREIDQILVRERRLRWPVPAVLHQQLKGQTVRAIERRAKYLIFRTDRGAMLVHLGMSGSLRVVPATTPAEKHDHIDWIVGSDCLRFRDPRRFGAVLWTKHPAEHHIRLRHLGPEPLCGEFNGRYLYECGRHRRIAVKQLLMDSKVVVGVGNIYANEALFRAGIRPTRPSDRIARSRYQHLAQQVQAVLCEAIEQGGTTLRDFRREDGQPGYFRIQLKVYGRAGEPCPTCHTQLRQLRIGQRASVYCPRCQR